MHAWLCENPVGADALIWKDIPTPQPKPGEILLEHSNYNPVTAETFRSIQPVSCQRSAA